jgi:lysozyme
MNFDVALRQLLSLHEGRKRVIYKDSLGFWTGGVGRLLDPAKGGHFNEDEIDLMLTNDIKEHSAELLKFQPWVAQLDDVRRAVMFDMTFNLGVEPFDHDGFKDWPMFIGQVQRGEYAAAAVNMRATAWAQQVGSRAQRLSKMMETGIWPQEVA